MNKDTIILYYSQTGITKAVAEELQKALGCDIARIEAVEPYGTDYDATIQRWLKELENHTKVEIQPLDVDLSKYSTVFLGFPVWGGIFPTTIATFLADNSLAGKKIVVFTTFGSGGLEGSTAAVAAAQPEADVRMGYGVRDTRLAKVPAELHRFLVENGYKAGSVEPLPQFSAPEEINEETAAIFDKACGSYEFPLGTPVAVSDRKLPEGREYKFDVATKTHDGNDARSNIYVTVEEGKAPEFTRVVML